jgi:hypothetical protein
VGISERWEDIRKWAMYVNGKMRPVKTIPGMGRGWIKENGRGINSTLMDCKNFCKCHNLPLVQQ